MSVSDKLASRKMIELQSLLTVSEKMQDFIQEQVDNEASLAAAIAEDSKESIIQKMKHLQNKISYIQISKELTSFLSKETQGHEEILKAYLHQQE